VPVAWPVTARFRTVLVEDDRLLRLLNRTLLEQSGRFDVVAEADDGERALMQVARHQPDCVILDLVMPNTDGFQAIPKIRMANPKSCIVVVSMLPQRGTEEEVVRLGASCFIDKAEDSERFVRLSIEAVERWQSKMRRTGRALAPSP
jgi:two-component system, NarL family, response regulator DesR